LAAHAIHFTIGLRQDFSINSRISTPASVISASVNRAVVNISVLIALLAKTACCANLTKYYTVLYAARTVPNGYAAYLE
jgi:hypothetical protein